MKLVPVLDLKGGQVVHAREGHRDRYAPLRSSLCEGADPLVVVEALMRIFDFDTVYVADLDAIEKRGHHRRVLEAIRRRFPGADLWVDSGISDLATLERWLAADLG